MYEALEHHGINISLTNPLKTRDIAEARIKYDKLDTSILALVLLLLLRRFFAFFFAAMFGKICMIITTGLASSSFHQHNMVILAPPESMVDAIL
jgi:hypothetical protein